MVESDLPYATRDNSMQNYCWRITTRCADVELACRYLDWLYSEEGTLIMSWGVQGVSYDVDADGNKYFLEGYDYTYQARHQLSGNIDFTATLASYDEKTKAMILDTMAAAEAGGNKKDPSLTFEGDAKTVFDTYNTGYADTKNMWLQNFMLGRKDVNNDADWQEFKDALAAQHVDEVIAAFNTAYASLLASKQ